MSIYARCLIGAWFWRIPIADLFSILGAIGYLIAR